MKYLLMLCVVMLLGAAPQVSPDSQGKHFLGCPYPLGGVYRKDISQSQISPSSGAWIKAIVDAGGNTGFQDWSGPQMTINSANDSTPMVTVVPQPGSGHRVYGPIPFQSNFLIQKPGTDQHYLVLQTQACRYYETFMTYSYPPNIQAYSTQYNQQDNTAGIDLKTPFVQPQTGGNGTASGIPLGLLAVRPEELTAGLIPHALGWDGISFTWSQTASVSPAGVTSATDGHIYRGPSGDTPMPYGAHARLKATFTSTACNPSAKEALVVLTAMKRFGLYAVDTGSYNSIEMVNDSYGAPVWTTADYNCLYTVTPSQFDIVPPPASPAP